MKTLPHILLILLIVSFLDIVSSQYAPSQITSVTELPSNSLGTKKFPLEQQVKKLTNLLAGGDLSGLDRTINAVITSQNIECPQMSKYVSAATQLLKNRVSANAQELKSITQAPKLQPQDTKKYQQLRTMLLNLKNSLLQKNYDAEIKLRETEKNIISENVNKYSDKCNSYLNSLREFKKNNNIITNNGKEDTAVIKLQAELKSLQEQINDTSIKRSSLHKNMTIIKSALLAKQIASRESTSEQKLEDDYRKYSELALNASQKAKDKQQQLARLKVQLQTKQKTPTTIDDEIDKATKELDEKKTGTTAKAVTIMKNANDVLKANLKNLEDRISIVESTCVITS